MCMRWRSSKLVDGVPEMPCKFGDECHYAHGRDELRKWRKKAGLPRDDRAGDEGEGEGVAAQEAAEAAAAEDGASPAKRARTAE